MNKEMIRFQNVSECEFAPKTLYGIKLKGIETVQQLVDWYQSTNRLLNKHIGQKSLGEIEQFINDNDLYLWFSPLTENFSVNLKPIREVSMDYLSIRKWIIILTPHYYIEYVDYPFKGFFIGCGRYLFCIDIDNRSITYER